MVEGNRGGGQGTKDGGRIEVKSRWKVFGSPKVSPRDQAYNDAGPTSLEESQLPTTKVSTENQKSAIDTSGLQMSLNPLGANIKNFDKIKTILSDAGVVGKKDQKKLLEQLGRSDLAGLF